MPKLELTSSECRALRAAAHALHPVVLIGDNGLTPAVLQEIDRGLRAHELIKIHVADTDRGNREAMLATICDSLSCAAVHHLGRMLIIYRPEQAMQRKKEADAANPVAARRRSGRHIPKKQAAHAHDARATNAAPLAARKTRGEGSRPAASAASGLQRRARSSPPAKAAGARGIVRRTGSALTLRAGARRGRTTRS